MLDERIKKYMEERSCLSNSCKPKHHFFPTLQNFSGCLVLPFICGHLDSSSSTGSLKEWPEFVIATSTYPLLLLQSISCIKLIKPQALLSHLNPFLISLSLLLLKITAMNIKHYFRQQVFQVIVTLPRRLL